MLSVKGTLLIGYLIFATIINAFHLIHKQKNYAID